MKYIVLFALFMVSCADYPSEPPKMPGTYHGIFGNDTIIATISERSTRSVITHTQVPAPFIGVSIDNNVMLSHSEYRKVYEFRYTFEFDGHFNGDMILLIGGDTLQKGRLELWP